MGDTEFLIREIIMGRCKCNEIQKKNKKKWQFVLMARLVSDTHANGKLDTWKLVSYFFFFLGEWRGEQMKHGINVIYVEFYVNL